MKEVKIWMWKESLVSLVAWLPGVLTHSSTSYAHDLDDLARFVKAAKDNDGKCIEKLEVMSHGGHADPGTYTFELSGGKVRITNPRATSVSFIELGTDTVWAQRVGLSPGGDSPYFFNGTAPQGQRLIHALEVIRDSLCVEAELYFSACNQGEGDILRGISTFIGKHVLVSGNSATGVPSLLHSKALGFQGDLAFVDGNRQTR
jgi:hypothetical protein